MNSALAAASPLAETCGVQVAPAPPNSGRVRGAQDYLARALQSLLEVAIKFAHAGTTVRLTEATSPGTISVFIETQGGTIPPAVLPRFFDLLAVSESFVGVDALGLGPSLAARIVAMYGGMVSVENLAPPGIRLLVCLKTDEAVP